MEYPVTGATTWRADGEDSPAAQPDAIRVLGNMNIGDQVGQWMPALLVHIALDLGQPLHAHQVDDLEYRILGEDAIQRLPVPIVNVIAVARRQLVQVQPVFQVQRLHIGTYTPAAGQVALTC